MTVASEPNEPNQAGYAGAAATPEPDRTPEAPEEVDAEATAVPAGDLTGAVTDAMEPDKED
jgi:hypothetical protein